MDARLSEPVIGACLPFCPLPDTDPIADYLVSTVIDTVTHAMDRRVPFKAASYRAPFTTFVTDVLTKAEVKVPVLLVTLVYIDRAKPHLQIALEQWACERVFLGALILANKVCFLISTSYFISSNYLLAVPE